MRLVAFEIWPNSQIMMECKYSESTYISGSCICLKEGGCTCLRDGKVLPEDKKEDEDEVMYNDEENT